MPGRSPRRRRRRRGIALTSACPGFIRTPMTAEFAFPMPGLMSAERAAEIILRGIAGGRVRVAFPWWMAVGARIGGLLPPRWVAAFMDAGGIEGAPQVSATGF